MTEKEKVNYALIPHPSQPWVLLQAEAGRWTLPLLHTTEATGIRQELRLQSGLDVTVLGVVYRDARGAKEEEHAVYATDNHSPLQSLPEHACWSGRADLADLLLVVPEHRAVLETWLSEREHDLIPAKRVAWAQPGWFDRATAWIEEQVNSMGACITAPIEQMHVRIWSTVLRVQTTAGQLYFKAVSPAFTYEPALTQILSEHWPACIPPVVAVDMDQSWILTRDAGRVLRELLLTEDRSASIKHLESAFSLYARFQMETAAYSDTLLALSCPDRRLNVLPDLFERLIADTPVLLLDQRGGISSAELEQLRSFTPQVQQMCEDLASYGLPETLHHDDFHTRNILINEQGEYVFFDWGDTGIAHPFFSLFTALRSAKYVLGYDDDQLQRLREAYLGPWRLSFPQVQLDQAFQLAQRLAIFSRTLTWYTIVQSLEDQVKQNWEYADAVPYWLKLFLTNEEPDED